MDNTSEFLSHTDRMVYMRPILLSELPKDIQQQAPDVKHLFALHDAQGKQLALVAHPRIAVDLAREHDLTLQTLH